MLMDEVFDALTLSPREKKVLKSLIKHEQLTSFEIQKEASIQQPEVSMAVKTLINRKYIKSERVPKDNESYCQKMVYSLTTDAYKLMANVLKEKVAELINKSNLYSKLIKELIAMEKQHF